MRRLSLQADGSDVHRRIVSAESLLLGMDYDGTLTPIASHPSQARLSASTKRLLKRLASLPGVRVVLVSGRSIRDVKRIVGLHGLDYVGNHGLELHGPGVRYLNPVAQASRSSMRRIAEQLQAALEPVPGAWVEKKGLSVSLHWRHVPRSANRTFHRLVNQGLMPYRRHGTVRVTTGKRIVDIRPPVRWDKGRIITWILQHGSGGGRWRLPLVVYLGDDRTDEDAFRVVNRQRGISVFVGRSHRHSAARYSLRTPLEVTQWLNRVARWRQHPSIR